MSFFIRISYNSVYIAHIENLASDEQNFFLQKSMDLHTYFGKSINFI